MSDKIDEKFDKAEKVVDRTGKLILKIVGALVAVGLAVYAGLDQLGGDEPAYDPYEQGLMDDTLMEDSTYFNDSIYYED